MSSRFISPFFDAGNGITPSSGAKLFFFELDGVTPRDTFLNEAATGGSENTNPVVSDTTGLFGDIWIVGSYKVILQDKNSVQIWEGTPIREIPSTSDAATVKNFATLADAVADVNLVEDDGLNLAERLVGNGGGAMWDVVLASGVTTNTFDIVACTGIPSLALVLRKTERANYKQFGAVGNGSIDDLGAIQACYSSGARVIDMFDGNQPLSGDTPTNKYRITDAIDLGVSTVAQGVQTNGVANVVDDGRACQLFYDGATGATSAMFKIVEASKGYGMRFIGVNLNLNNKAAHGYMFVSGSVLESIKNMYFSDCYCHFIPEGGTGWRINDQSNVLGFGSADMDAWNYTFERCHARSEFPTSQTSGASGWIIDATNAFNISWKDCSDGQQGAGGMLVGIKTKRGSGYRVFNYFSSGGKSSATSIGDSGNNDVWAIDHRGGSMEIFGMNTEDFRVIRAASNGEADSLLTVIGVQVNEANATNQAASDFSIFSSISTVLINVTLFRGGNINKKVRCTLDLTADKVRMGSGGAYDLAERTRCNIEGIAVGSMSSIGPNSAFQGWWGAGVNENPLGWKQTTLGNATFTRQRDGSNNFIGRYTAKIDVTVANTSTGNVTGIEIDASMEMSQYRGRKMFAYAIINGPDTDNASLEVAGLPTNATFVTAKFDTSYSDGSAMTVLYGVLDLTSATLGTLTTLGLKVGIRNNLTGTIYIDSAGYTLSDFSNFIPAFAMHAQNLEIGLNSEYLDAGVIPVGKNAFRRIDISTVGPGHTGDHQIGDWVINQAPVAGGKAAFVCVTAGNPGVWKAWGDIDA